MLFPFAGKVSQQGVQQAHVLGSITSSSTPVHSRTSGGHQSHLLVSATPSQPQLGHSIARPAHPTPRPVQPQLPRTAAEGSESLPQLSPRPPQEVTETRQEEPAPDSPGFILVRNR